jgi:cyclopropane-fatty-acyl-phospholipid synthase
MSLATWATRFAERVPLPDVVTRAVLACFVAQARKRLADPPADVEAKFAAEMQDLPIAEYVHDAKAQHYDLPATFMSGFLGPRLKYSCAFYRSGAETLAHAEATALANACEQAGIADGQRILELGCGWGCMALWMAESYPAAAITCVSNSDFQRLEIEAQIQARGIANLTVITADMNDFRPEGRFDRVVSVEMFEHIADWGGLLHRVRSWLEPDGRLFLHVFAHREHPYRFDHTDGEDWIGHYFFAGATMPSHGLIRQFPDLFEVEREWRWNGRHYQRTADAWLANFDRNMRLIKPLLCRMYDGEWRVWARRWRLFFLLTSVLFAAGGGHEWGVSRYRLKPTGELG